ncbi:MAG: hypothetical protein ACOCT0_01270 [Halobacteriota archaeon]
MSVDPVETAEDSVWWLVWRRHQVLLVGVGVGLVAGYGVDALGPGGLAVGLASVVFGYLSPTFFYLLLFVYAGLAGVYTFADGRAVLEMFLDPEGAIAVSIARFLLLLGEQAGFELEGASDNPVGAVGGVLSTLATWSLVGFAVGGVSWAAMASFVNTRYEDYVDGFREEVREAGESLLGSEPFTYVQGRGSKLLLWPAMAYYATNVVVGRNSIMLHHGSKLDLGSRSTEISDSTKQLYYDQVSSLDYDDPYFRIRMSDGEVISLHTESKPVELMNLIARGLQDFKSQAAKRSAAQGGVEVQETRGRPDDEPLDEQGEMASQSTSDREKVDDEAGGVAEAGDAETESGDDGGRDLGADILDEVNEILDEFDEHGDDFTSDLMSGDVDGDVDDTGGADVEGGVSAEEDDGDGEEDDDADVGEAGGSSDGEEDVETREDGGSG